MIFGSAHGLGADLAAAARRGGLALCGGGCMGFVNPARGIRAIGYNEHEDLGPGTGRADHPLGLGLLGHAAHASGAALQPGRQRRPGARDDGVGLPASTPSASRRPASSACSWRRCAMPTGCGPGSPRQPRATSPSSPRPSASPPPVERWSPRTPERSPAETAPGRRCSSATASIGSTTSTSSTDTLELFAIGRRIPRSTRRPAIATVHDSGGERALIADAAEAVGVAFAPLTDKTRTRLTEILDEGLAPTNPLDVWGTGADTRAVHVVPEHARRRPAVGARRWRSTSWRSTTTTSSTRGGAGRAAARPTRPSPCSRRWGPGCTRATPAGSGTPGSLCWRA